ncbi:MAG TPA: FeoA family protein [Spirochaetota bacterium]|jgi:ferrous iron transport protein A|nr:FeoA family protein [Spirochaetota bacterium]HOH36895.1 FeoA family protein [Spirochaetota bacterium]HPJ15861.1 FeoA family protein [Spirochaetota bacterium]HPM34661.1 FeoA family protein [Spirochaetota bacterium]HPY04292.1 FeoA family protein [Spirochaetota bacterium]
MQFKIRDFSVGESGEITGYDSSDSSYRKKLLSMGLTKGTVVTVTKTAPLGDPVELTVRGYKLSLRKAEADILELRRQNNDR